MSPRLGLRIILGTPIYKQVVPTELQVRAATKGRCLQISWIFAEASAGAALVYGGNFSCKPDPKLGKSGRGLPHSKTLRDSPSGLGLRQSSGAMVRGMKWNGSRSQRWGFRDFTSGTQPRQWDDSRGLTVSRGRWFGLRKPMSHRMELHQDWAWFLQQFRT
jgi:hypothetical protein